MLSLEWDGGTVVIRGGKVDLPYAKYDDRAKAYRILAINYPDLTRRLKSMGGVQFEDHVMEVEPCMIRPKRDLRLREYQRTALQRWLVGKRGGVVVMPTGMGGKTTWGGWAQSLP